jgi:hypothetical protein
MRKRRLFLVGVAVSSLWLWIRESWDRVFCVVSISINFTVDRYLFRLSRNFTIIRVLLGFHWKLTNEQLVWHEPRFSNEFYRTVCELLSLVVNTISIAEEQPSEVERMSAAFNTENLKIFVLIMATFETWAIF